MTWLNYFENFLMCKPPCMSVSFFMTVYDEKLPKTTQNRQTNEICCFFCSYAKKTTAINTNLKGAFDKFKAIMAQQILEHDQPQTAKKKFKCDSCDRSYTQNKNLLAHKRAVHALIILKYSCLYCAAKFRTASGLVTHAETIHDKPLSLIEAKSAITHVKNTVKKKSGVKVVRGTLICDICGTTASGLFNMRRHMMKQHVNKLKNSKRNLS